VTKHDERVSNRAVRSSSLSLFVLALSVSASAAASGGLGCSKSGPKPPDLPTATLAEPLTAPSVALNGAKNYELDLAASKVGFAGSNITGTQEGSIKFAAGSLAVEGTDLSKINASVSIDMSTLQTNVDGLTKHLKSGDFFDVEHFPTATFTSAQVKPGGERGATHTISGVIEIRGTKKQISFPATIKFDGPRPTLHAQFLLDRQPFGVAFKGAPDNLIRDEVAVTLDLVGSVKQ
jgi:polyisoprenoid-binding protein YceI